MNVTVEARPSINTGTLRILVVDDHEVVRHGMQTMLEAQPNWTICGEAATAREAIDMAREFHPDVVVIDIHMPGADGAPGMDGLQATREILIVSPKSEVLIFTIDEDFAVVQAAMEAGACGVVMKSDVARDLFAAIAALARHEPFYSQKASQALVQGLMFPPGGPQPEVVAGEGGLTKREREVVVLVAEGHSNKQVAVTLGISGKTVETHRANIMHKLGLKHTAELVRYAMRDGLIQP
jgi:DNA-binding NarL/FixJ family response regulator